MTIGCADYRSTIPTTPLVYLTSTSGVVETELLIVLLCLVVVAIVVVVVLGVVLVVFVARRRRENSPTISKSSLAPRLAAADSQQISM